jgi:hypothetical protein
VTTAMLARLHVSKLRGGAEGGGAGWVGGVCVGGG